MTVTNLNAMWTLGSSCLIHKNVNEICCSRQSYLFEGGTKDLSQRLDAEQQIMSTLAKSNKKIAHALAPRPDKLVHGWQGSYEVDTYSSYQLHYGRPYSTKCGCLVRVSSREAIGKRKTEGPTAVHKIVDFEKLSGHDNVGDANEESHHRLTSTMRTAISDATAALHAAAITAAVKDIIRLNDVDRHSKIVTGFSVAEKDVIAAYLSKGLAEFDIQVLLKSRPRKATIRLCRTYFQVFVQKKRLFPDLDSLPLEVRIQKGSQFILKLSNGCSYTCDTEGDFILRDKIVVTATAFLKKMSLLAEKLSTWTKPPTGWLKLNTNGSMHLRDKQGGIGGLIRDDSGTWVTGFLGKLTMADNILLQLEALKRGLYLAQEIRGTQKIIVGTDSVILILLQRKYQVPHPYSRLVIECKQLLKELGESNYKLVHIEWNSNSPSHCLADLGLQQMKNMEVKILDIPPEILRLILRQDSTGLPSYMLHYDKQ